MCQKPQPFLTPKAMGYVCVTILLLLICPSIWAQEVRIKDLVNIKGNRPNQLIGFGLVVGLAGTGDSAESITTNKAIANLFTNLGIETRAEVLQSQSAAAVIVTAELPAFAKNGDRIDVKASVVGDATSIAGGTLLTTALKAGNGLTYVISSGTIVVGQADGAGPKVLTVARIPQGGMIEREFIPEIVDNGFINLSLRHPDFTTNARITERINEFFKGFFATSLDPSHIRVQIPLVFSNKIIEFISQMELLKVKIDQKAQVVLNERTGTVVMGSEVVIGNIMIAHGDLSIQITDKKDQTSSENLVNIGGTTVGNLVKSLNALGIKPADLIGILQAIHAAGALKAEIKFL